MVKKKSFQEAAQTLFEAQADEPIAEPPRVILRYGSHNEIIQGPSSEDRVKQVVQMIWKTFEGQKHKEIVVTIQKKQSEIYKITFKKDEQY